jgi:hypothetical protein
MNGGSYLRGLRSDADERVEDPWIDEVSEPMPPSQPELIAPEWTQEPEGSRMPVIIGVALLLVALIWVGGMLWWARDVLPRSPLDVAEFVAALLVPPLLAAVLWQLLLRTSRAEARRFGATARAMRAESDRLEASVGALAQRIEANRRALVEQAQSLVSIGDMTAERMNGIAGELSAEARILDTIGGSLAQSAARASESLATVFEALPKAQAETVGLTQALTAAGYAAGEQTAALDAQLSALAERGRDAEEVASGAAARLASQVAAIEASSTAGAARLESAAGEISGAVDTALDRAATAIDEARRGIAAHGEAMLAMLTASQAALDKAGREGTEAIAMRLADVEGAVERLGTALAQESARSDTLFAGLNTGIERTSGQFAALHGQGMEQTQALSAAISALAGSTTAMTETMRIGETAARTLIATAEDLLTALDASAREIDETLPDALERLESRIGASRTMVSAAKPELLALVSAAESTHDAVDAVAGLVTAEREKLAQITSDLNAALDAGHDKAATMDELVATAIANTRRFAEDAAPGLVTALARIRETAEQSAERAREVLTSVVPEASAEIEAASTEAVRRAFARALPQPIEALSQASERAVVAASRASERLATQIMAIAESTAELEKRIDEERAAREENNRDNFARRMSLLVEALNSASIDIAKAFDAEITDSAWAAYLKGDRGVFTRRAVRLLDGSDAREIARLHEDDPAFREHVNRYIHDFEAMLRQVLAMRDGSPLGVTLLSSDMGKLYVALAQAIERLRT